MAKIIIAGPSQRIHRFLLPPHSRHVMSHDFPGGGVVLARILHRLVCPAKDDARYDAVRKVWEAELTAWEKKRMPMAIKTNCQTASSAWRPLRRHQR